MKHLLLVVSMLCASLCAMPSAGAAAQIPLAPQSGNIVDKAEVLTAEQEETLNKKLADYTTKTGVEIGVLTVNTIENDYLENFSISVAREWGIGKKDANNGALLLIVVEQRQLRIEVGTGLEGELTDARSGRIIRDRITPEFKNGNYYKGINDGLDGMILAINAQEDAALSSASSDGPTIAESVIGVGVFASYLIFALITWLGAILGRSKRWWPGGVAGALVGTAGVGIISQSILAGLFGGILVGVSGLILDYFVSKNYRQAKNHGDTPAWWAGGGFGSGSSGGSSGGGGFSGGGSFGGGGSSGSW